MKKISKLQFITTNAATAEQACMGGVDWIQLRLKNVSYDEYFAVGKEVQAVCRKYNAIFIVNDDVKLALDLDADGVHVGKEDSLPQHYIDEMLSKGKIIGCTTNTTDDILHFKGKPVSYLGLGPFRFTTTKQKLSPILGIEGYKEIFEGLKHSDMNPIPPIIGIGGVTIEDVAALLGTGLHGIAVSGAISNAADVTDAARQFKSLLNQIK